MAYLVTQPISGQRMVSIEQQAIRSACGALVTFVGIVRGDRHGGRLVTALSYEAYVPMAESMIGNLVTESRARWWLDAVHVQHRLGLVEVGQISVLIITAAQHRAAAYGASQVLIDQIKQHVPIWKREHYDDGTSQWSPTSAVPTIRAEAHHTVKQRAYRDLQEVPLGSSSWNGTSRAPACAAGTAGRRGSYGAPLQGDIPACAAPGGAAGRPPPAPRPARPGSRARRAGEAVALMAGWATCTLGSPDIYEARSVDAHV